MSNPIKTTLKEIVENPNKYLGREVEVEGTLTYAGKAPRGPVYTINLPQEEYCVGILKSGDASILCYGLEALSFCDYDQQKVVITGIVIRVQETIALRVLRVKFVK
ncbi:MAG: hypothetical protein B6U95_07240 [Thermofilum sp. ex4484_82]|nr:MAG: hypothetical protein B6U95_07240 [Thermofilum sp. ex4484_82]OYT37232.1 MAG: hypothetical protein B6U96_07235 [Archaeoglobales archaeon ex4484_92]